MDAPWRIELLGWLRAEYDGRVITRFRTRKTESLLAYLAYYQHRSHPRQELIELLWPECDPSVGRRRLRVELSSLRRQFEPPGVPPGAVLVSDHATVQLNPIACVTDVARFDTLLRAAEAGSEAERVHGLEEAIELSRGPLLPGYFDEWILPERQRLEEAYLQALEQLMALQEQAGNLHGALQYARRAAAADPLREETHHRLIRLLTLTGQPEAAAGHYDEWQRRLKSLGAEAPEPHDQGEERPGPGGATKPGRLAGPSHNDVRAPGGTLPLQFTRFFGREREISRLQELLLPLTTVDPPAPRVPGRQTAARQDRQEPSRCAFVETTDYRLASPVCRLVTLTGPGGSGKTRLAIEVAQRLQEPFQGAVWFVPLVDLSDPLLIVDKLFEALHLPCFPGAEPLEQVASFLAWQHSLLVFDNFEHLVADGAPLIQTLRERVATLTVLVTSRQRLGLPGEREVPLGPLPAPVDGSWYHPLRGYPVDGSDRPDFVGPSTINRVPAERVILSTLLQCPSVRLFADRAQAVRPDFQLTPANVAAVAGLCEKLEGLPLALELAAARAGVLTPSQILARLESALTSGGTRFELLTSRQRAADARHRSLRAALDWSYQLLSPALQRFFARLSVFRGGWTLAAAETVCEEPKGLDFLEELRECSLVVVEDAGQEVRYRLLETLREYGAEQLGPAAQRMLAEKHAQFFLALAQDHVSGLRSIGTAEARERTWRERDNLHAALAWAQSDAGDHDIGLRLAGLLVDHWRHSDLRAQGRRWLQTALDQTTPRRRCPVRARALYALGLLLREEGDLLHARLQLEESISIWKETDDLGGLAWSLYALAFVWKMTGDIAADRTLTQQARALFRQVGDLKGLASSTASLGGLAQRDGDLATASALFQEAAAIGREIGDDEELGWTLSLLGGIAEDQGDLEHARELFEEGLDIFERLRFGSGIAAALGNLGGIALAQGDYTRARSLFGESLARWREAQEKPWIADSLYDRALVERFAGEYSLSRSFAEEALAIAQEIGDRKVEAMALHTLGCIACAQGHLEAAWAFHEESLRIKLAMGDRRRIASGLEGAAGVAAAGAQWELAARLLGAADALRAEMGVRLPQNEQAENQERLSTLRRAMEESAFGAAWAAGQALTWEQAIAAALGGAEAPPLHPVRQIPAAGASSRAPESSLTVRGDLTAEEWERIAPLLPPATGQRGRPYQDHRRVINGILWKLRTGAPWRDLPSRYGCWHTCHDRYARWQHQGLWDRISQALQDPAAPAGP